MDADQNFSLRIPKASNNYTHDRGVFFENPEIGDNFALTFCASVLFFFREVKSVFESSRSENKSGFPLAKTVFEDLAAENPQKSLENFVRKIKKSARETAKTSAKSKKPGGKSGLEVLWWR